MNIHDLSGSDEATIRYLDGDYRVIKAGSFVRCALTGKPIAIDELKYWSVERQEAYIDIITSVKAEKAANGSS